jgi:sugar/nucleoside kinase (ribokinase family)
MRKSSHLSAGHHAPMLIVSTVTRDILTETPGASPEVVRGGPGHYIARAFDRLGAHYRLITHTRVDVEVIRTPDGEVYRVPCIPPIPLPQRLDGPAVLLSPIGGEIDPNTVPPVDGLLVIDIQGFVRESGVRSDQTTRLFHLAPLLRRCALVKASEDELLRLDQESRQALLSTTTLITAGARGARLVRESGTATVPAHPVATTSTIGAGDTFLASMVWAMVNGCPMERAAERAARFTETVLQARTAR